MAKIVVATVEYRFSVDDDIAALVFKEILLQKNNGTRLSENYGIFDFEPDEQVMSVEIE